MSDSSKVRLRDAVEIIRLGGSLLKEACPRCNGVQVSLKGRIICVSCGDLASATRTEMADERNTVANLKDLVLSKVRETSRMLGEESDVEKQADLASLLLKFIEIVEKIDRMSEKVA